MFIKIWIVVYFGIFLIKILSNSETKNILAFAFGLSFVFGTYVGHCILSFFLQEKKQKIVAEYNLLLKKYECESTDFREFLHTKKSEKKGSLNGTNTT